MENRLQGDRNYSSQGTGEVSTTGQDDGAGIRVAAMQVGRGSGSTIYTYKSQQNLLMQ